MIETKPPESLYTHTHTHTHTQTHTPLRRVETQRLVLRLTYQYRGKELGKKSEKPRFHDPCDKQWGPVVINQSN